ncbi:MAG: heme exporter protein CcmD [Rubrivivax sp.]|jgi:heme exporter protein D|nr:heme exporter protein CcmD [Rubrivivax sp.]
MNWGSASEFFAMGGYGFFVWGSYAVTAALMVGEAVLVIGRHRAARAAVGRPNLEDDT